MPSPLEIKIALHYYTDPTEYEGGAGAHYHSVAVQGILSDFTERGYLVELAEPNQWGGRRRGTPALDVYVAALRDVPLPVQRWVIPDRAVTAGNETK